LKTLLVSVRDALRNDATLDFIPDQDIVITPDLDLIPVSMNFPGLLIKDGDVRRTPLTNRKFDLKESVMIAILIELEEGDISVIGQDTPKIYGVTEIAKLLHQSLTNNMLGIAGMETAWPGDELESETIGHDNTDLVLQRKIVSFEYQRQETIP